MVVGTPAYISPEQAAGSRDLSGRSDLYSLGCVLYEMLAGRPPFIGPTLESLVHQHLNLEPRPVSALRVISRTSVMTYKGACKPLPAIARELNVDAIMEGTVLPVGDEVRITAQLISTRDDALLWSESFDRHLCDVLSLQGEVARAIAAAVRVELSRAERSLLGNRRQVDPEVYRRELMGRQAMARLRYAIELDPLYVPALFYLGLSLTRVGRGDDAIEAIEQAVQLSGRLARTLTYLVFACARAGRRERAMEVLAELEERARTSYVPSYFLATAHGALGHLDRAMEWLERGYMERDVMMRDLAVDPASEPLRQDERGRDVLRRMGLAR